ncbi:MAG TPA: BlaI/MecI/CopY family transcriptional regulator [Tepidisphaeraceae bacterium]|jgi:predicted transcriptional regulator
MAKHGDVPDLSEAQIEIMNVIWDAPAGAGVMDVWKALAAKRQVARNTVQTTLVRLEEKGWLGHRDSPTGGFIYFARHPRNSTLRNIVTKLVETAFAGSADDLVMALIQGRGVSKQEARRIREMIDKAERSKS